MPLLDAAVVAAPSRVSFDSYIWGESFARDAAACMVDIAVDIVVAVDIAVGNVVDIAVDIGVAVAGASLAAVLPFVDKAEPFAWKIRLDRVFKEFSEKPFLFVPLVVVVELDMVYKVVALDSDTFASWGFWKHVRNPPFFS